MNFPFVDRLHVSATDAEVEAALRKALKPGIPESHPAVFKKYLKMALKQHRANRNLYGYVMGGMQKKRKNPELLIVRNPIGGFDRRAYEKSDPNKLFSEGWYAKYRGPEKIDEAERKRLNDKVLEELRRKYSKNSGGKTMARRKRRNRKTYTKRRKGAVRRRRSTKRSHRRKGTKRSKRSSFRRKAKNSHRRRRRNKRRRSKR